MFNIVWRKAAVKIFITAAVVYFILMLLSFFISRDYTLKQSSGIALSALCVTITGALSRNRVKFILIISFIFLLAISIFGVKLDMKNYIELNDVKTYFSFIIALINLAFLLPTFFKNLYLCNVVRFIMFSIILLPAVLITGYYFVTGTWFASDALLAIFQTNIQEMVEYFSDYVSYKILLGLLLGAFLLVFTTSKIEKIEINNRYKYILVTICIVISIIDVNINRHNIITYIVKNSFRTLDQYKAFSAAKTIRQKNLDKIIVNEKDTDGIYVLVIGESQNKNHMNAYGYERMTTPWLSRHLNERNMLLFTNAYSCHTHTVQTLLFALTAKNQYNKLDVRNAVSLLEVVEAAGYDTVWLSNQVKFSAYDTPITSIADEANQQKWINSNLGEKVMTDYFDGKLVDEIDKIKISNKMFIVIHLMGNHTSYEQRYPKEFNKFAGGNIVDKYDNSILYNDYVMSMIFAKLKKLPNFKGLIYCSDHADAVDKNLGHDSSRFNFDMTQIPLYVYLSDSYISFNKDKYNKILQRKDSVITNDLLFNLVLTTMGIKIDGMYEPENDIISDYFDSNIDRFTTLYGKKHIAEEKL